MENDEMVFKTDNVIELKLNSDGNSLKDVKNKLTKTGSIDNLTQLNDEILGVVDNYYNKTYKYTADGYWWKDDQDLKWKWTEVYQISQPIPSFE